MESRFIEYSGKMYQVQVNKVDNVYITDIFDVDKIVASLKFKAPPTDEVLKTELQILFHDRKEPEVEE